MSRDTKTRCCEENQQLSVIESDNLFLKLAHKRSSGSNEGTIAPSSAVAATSKAHLRTHVQMRKGLRQPMSVTGGTLRRSVAHKRARELQYDLCKTGWTSCS